MKHAGFYFLGLAYIPEVFAKVSAGTAGNIHSLLILVVASGTFPLIVIVNDYLSVKAADMAVVGFRVEFGILNIVVYKADNILKCFEIMAHIGDFNIRNRTA